MHHFHILTRRGFLDRSMKIGLGVALSTLSDIPFVVKRALAEGNIGINGKKLLFIWLRGANDALNSVVPILDPAYAASRPTNGGGNIGIPADAIDYSALGPCDFPVSGVASSTYDSYPHAIRLGNGFAALHPSLKFLAPVYNAGDLALVHRVAYANQSRSHFDSQNYWENGTPNNNLVTDGIFYRTMIASGLANTAPLTGVTVQSGLPLILRGSAAAMTNLTDPTRYNLLGIPNTAAGNTKADTYVNGANAYPFPTKLDRQFLSLQYQNLSNTLQIFAAIDFTETGNTFLDDTNTDGDVPYYLFPTTSAKNGGAYLNGRSGDTTKYVTDTGGYSFFTNLKAAALILNNTDAIVAGTEFTGFDTHNNQGGVTGAHANLQRRIGWAIYGLRKYFLNHANKVNWNNVIVVTLSEFGRTTVQNSSLGTDHAEAGLMFVAGGSVKGYGKAGGQGLISCSPNDANLPWVVGPSGSMFGASGRYLKRTIDYRSVLGKLIRDHLGATQNQLNQIIPGYAVSGEALLAGGTSSIDGTTILGEPPII